MLAKSKLNRIEVLIFKALIDSVISHDEFVLINNVLKEHNEIKEENKNLKTYRPSDLACVACVAKAFSRKVFDCTRQFIKDFSLFITECYRIII